MIEYCGSKQKSFGLRACFFAALFFGSFTTCDTSVSSNSSHLIEKIKQADDLYGCNILITTKKPLCANEPGTFMPSMGAGDIFQLLTYVQCLQDRSANVVYEVPKYLRSIVGTCADVAVLPQKGKIEYQEIELSVLYDELGCVQAFKSKKPIFYFDAQLLQKWERFVDQHAGNDMPVVVFWGCAKNHNHDRELSSSLPLLFSPLEGIKFFDLEYKSPYKFPGVIKPSDFDPDFDKQSFVDTAAFLHVVFSRGGKVIAPTSGPLHLACQVARGVATDCVYACVAEFPNERWWEGKYEGNTRKKGAWYNALLLFRQNDYKSGHKKGWDGVVLAVRERLKRAVRTN